MVAVKTGRDEKGNCLLEEQLTVSLSPDAPAPVGRRLGDGLEGPDLRGVGTTWSVQAPLYVGGRKVQMSRVVCPKRRRWVGVGQAAGESAKKGGK